MAIKIGNIRTFKPDGSIAIRVDRGTPLGNPFYMCNESVRDYVCDRYEEYFNAPHPIIFNDELNRIVDLAKINDITLLCWCYPKRCHAETIKRYIENRLKQEVHE